MVFEKVREIIAEQLNIDAEEISLDTNVTKDLEADSLDAVEIILAIEDEYDIEIPEDQAEQFQLVSNIVKYIEDNSDKA
ncbi:MAG: acyl carrier protein [Firmicutes bacterium]|jgi:acyl carrier protein|nr:acyl carrier protein [Bacillota bacterium]